MSDRFNLLVSELGESRVKKEEALKFHTHTKIGGPAEYFYIATSRREFIKVLEVAEELNISVTILGGGTKMLISDKGIKGLVVKNRSNLIKISGIKGKVGKGGIGVEEVILEVDSGVSIKSLNEFLKKQQLQTLNVISSEYASVGGSLYIDPGIAGVTEKVVIWEDGEEETIEIHSLKRQGQIILGLLMKIKAAN